MLVILSLLHGIETTCFDFKASHFSVHIQWMVGLVLMRLLVLLDDDGEPK